MIKLKNIDYKLLADFIKVITQSGYKALVEESDELSELFDTLFFNIGIVTGPEDNA